LDVRVVLVEPQYEGNVGLVARTMKNFGLRDLWLVKPKVKLGVTAEAFSSHARDVLSSSNRVDTFDEALEDVSYVVGTTSIFGRRPSNVLRTVVTPEEFARRVARIRGKVAILFGREDIGLLNSELEKCDLSVTIPADQAYGVLNMAVASAIMFYELYKASTKPRASFVDEADHKSRAMLSRLFSQLCLQAKLPPHKRRLALRAFRNITARAFISRRELTLLMGVFRKALRPTGGLS